jgi:hypothetical protein
MTKIIDYLVRLVTQSGRLFLWASVGAVIAALVGVWAGVWFGSYQALLHNDFAFFWTAFSFCVAAAAVSGAITGAFAFVGDGANPISSTEECTWKTETLAEASRDRMSAVKLPPSLAARMRLNPHTRSRVAHKA